MASVWSRNYIIILILAVVVSLFIPLELPCITPFEFFAFAAATFPILIFYVKSIAPIPLGGLEKYNYMEMKPYGNIDITKKNIKIKPYIRRGRKYIQILINVNYRADRFRLTANALLVCWATTLLLFISLIILKENTYLLDKLRVVQNFIGGDVFNRFLVSAGYTQMIFSVLIILILTLNQFRLVNLDEWVLVKKQLDERVIRIGILYVMILLIIFL